MNKDKIILRFTARMVATERAPLSLADAGDQQRTRAPPLALPQLHASVDLVQPSLLTPGLLRALAASQHGLAPVSAACLRACLTLFDRPAGRRFVVSYFMMDDSILIFEPPIRNRCAGHVTAALAHPQPWCSMHPRRLARHQPQDCARSQMRLHLRPWHTKRQPGDQAWVVSCQQYVAVITTACVHPAPAAAALVAASSWSVRRSTSPRAKRSTPAR